MARNIPGGADINPATGKAYAINPSSGVWDDNYWAQVVEPQLRTQYGPEPLDPIETAKKLRQFTIESNQPAISSLQAQIPETSARFETERTRLGGEKEPLKQRYQSIIDELTRREGVDVTAAQRRTGQEFGYRGIPASSTLYLDELQRAEGPIRQAYGGQIKDVGFERESSLRGIEQLISNLSGQETESKRAIQNAIGQLQSGEPASAIQGAMSLIGLQQQQAQNQAQNELARQAQALSERQFGLQEEIARKPAQQDQYATLGEGSTIFDLLAGKPLYTAPKTYKSAVGAGGNASQYYGGGSQPSSYNSGNRYQFVS